jgi:hypothetical protein
MINQIYTSLIVAICQIWWFSIAPALIAVGTVFFIFRKKLGVALKASLAQNCEEAFEMVSEGKYDIILWIYKCR